MDKEYIKKLAAGNNNQSNARKNTLLSLPGNIPDVCSNESIPNEPTTGKKRLYNGVFTELVNVAVHASDNHLASKNEGSCEHSEEENDDMCCPFHQKFPDQPYRDPRRRECFSDTELENEDFLKRPCNLSSFKEQSKSSSWSGSQESLNASQEQENESDEFSHHILCLSDKTMERSTANWLSQHQSTVGSLENPNCRMCQAEHCSGCRYNFRFANSRFSGAQLKHWLSVPNVGQQRRVSFRRAPDPSRTPSVDETDQKKKFTRNQKITLICIGLVNFSSFLSMSIIAPFFPKEASNKGMREAVSGFVFSVYALVMMIASPLFGKLLPRTGARFMYLSGVFISGGANMLFGILDRAADGTAFTVLCFTVRSFEALGAAAFSTASYTIILDMFPDDIGSVFGVLELCVGVGMSLGPAVGGWLYAVGGYELPFFVLGAFVLLNVPLSWLMLSRDSDSQNRNCKTSSYKSLISIPLVMVICVVIVVSSQAQGFIDPTLEPHLRQYNLGSGVVGLLFLLTSAAYAIFSPGVGYLTGKWEVKYPIMLFGLLLMTVSLLLLGPSPILPFPGGLLWLNILGIVLLGVSFACSFIPTFEAILNAGLDNGLNDDLGTYSIVSGLWNAMCSLGEVTGPSLGGLLSDFLDFPLAATTMAIFSFLSAILVLFSWLCLGDGCRAKKVEKESDSGISDDSVADEKASLINKYEIRYGATNIKKDFDDPSVSV